MLTEPPPPQAPGPPPLSPAAEDLADWARRTIGDLDALLADLDTRPATVIPPPARVRALVGTAHRFGDQRPAELDAAMERERQELLGFARQAVAALKRGGGVRVPLTAQEQLGAAAILTFVTRPALRVSGDDFVEPPPSWQEDLERRRTLIRRTLPAVGRIEVQGHPQGAPWVGTAWVAAPGLLMTNRHVVKEFAQPVSPAPGETRWRIKPGMSARIDFGEEWTGVPATGAQRTYAIPDAAQVRVHPEHDLALVPVAATAQGTERRPLPAPLTIAGPGTAVTEGLKVYCVGYPARDEGNRELAAMYRLFDAIFDVKRLQPGQVMQVLPASDTLLHDCSTLGGNSGSCVLDLRTNQVLGLHYAGFHRHANLAIGLWRLAADPLLREAGVRFAGLA